MIDMHTHILPGIDDGSQSVEETQKMFNLILQQEIDTVVATPHLYLDETEIDTFLERREEAAKKVKANIPIEKRTEVALGAEVQFVPDLYAVDGIEKLCISGTRYLLVEMPFLKWSGYTYKALTKLYTARGIIPIVAHVERYLDFQDEDGAEVLRKIREANGLVQINSSFLTYRGTKRKALGFIKKGLVNFMGSDAHNTETRKPEIIKGFDVIYRKLGEDGLASFEYWEDRIREKLETF